MRYDLVIFDLDGTLLDTSPGIFGSVRYAEKMMNLEPIDNTLLNGFVGPPPLSMYKEIYGLSDADAMKATLAHRKYGMENAIYEAKEYPGMREVLETLKAKHVKLAVATLKKQKIAETILDNFSMREFFDCIVGMDDGETHTKKKTIEKAKKTVEVLNALMVGDSLYDYEGAMQSRTDFIGVLYGFGLEKGYKYPFETVDLPEKLLPRIFQ